MSDEATQATAPKTNAIWAFLSAPAGAALVFFFMVLIALTIFPGWSVIGTWMGKSDAPAWVQAVGSILAIGASAALVQMQHRLELTRQKAADLETRGRKLEIVVQLASSMTLATKMIAEGISTQVQLIKDVQGGKMASPEFIKFNDVLDAIPLYELDSAVVLAEVIILQKNCKAFSRILQAMTSEPTRLAPASFIEGKENLALISGECKTSFIKIKECLDKLREEISRTGS